MTEDRPTWALYCPGPPDSDEPEAHLATRLVREGPPPWRCGLHATEREAIEWQAPPPVPMARCADHDADEPAELLVRIRRVDRPGLDVWRHRPASSRSGILAATAIRPLPYPETHADRLTGKETPS